MAKAKYVLAIDQGTTGTHVSVLDARLRVTGKAYREFEQIFPKPGWVEHDLEEIWASVRRTVSHALRAAGIKGKDLSAIGITNQRETTGLWEREGGRPLHHAIVWQDRRTAERCAELKQQGREARVRELTGLVLDPYFSATKLEWLLSHVKGARNRADAGEVCFGTVDSWLVYKLTGDSVHVTDISNASRTLLMDLPAVQWLRDGLGLIKKAADVEGLAREADDTGEVVFVPALAGLGAPHWRPEARGLFAGIDRSTTSAHLARAVLEGIALQINDLALAMRQDAGRDIHTFKVDGGAAANDLLMQFEADVLGTPVVRPKNLETTSLGAAFLGGLGAGVWQSAEEIRAAWQADKTFTPRMTPEERAR